MGYWPLKTVTVGEHVARALAPPVHSLKRWRHSGIVERPVAALGTVLRSNSRKRVLRLSGFTSAEARLIGDRGRIVVVALARLSGRDRFVGDC